MTTTTSTAAIPGYKTGTWQIDPSHSEIGFRVRHMMVSKVRGRFTEFSADLVTADTVEDSSVTVSIDLASIQTGNEQRDGHLRSPDFFGTDENPTMTFHSTAVKPKGDDWVLEGELTLKGITKPVTLDFELEGVGPDAFGGYRAGFSATTVINRQDFDVTWNQNIEAGGVVVGDKVTIEIDAEFVLQA
jgi:polyisoprenoid-binding protein YceI